MKILEVAPFSSGICGVWARVKSEAELLSKVGHDVTVFSSNIKRGSDKIEFAESDDRIGKVRIKRFKTKGNFGQNTFFWNYEKEALELKPDIIITHAYRQYYSTKALKIAKKLKVPCLLVTHAPFLEKKLRSWKLNTMVWIYDSFVGRRIINKYDKILTITKWEVPYLLNLGCKPEKMEYLPNGIPDVFFETKSKEGKGILFFGRIAPVKNLETLIRAVKRPELEKIKVAIIGPAEEDYKKMLEDAVQKLEVKNVKFYPAVYDLDEKIKIMDEYEIFVLPSKREAMPQALIEAMARGKIVVSSKTEGGKEIIDDRKNGFLFEIGDYEQLGNILIDLEKKSKKEKDELRKKIVESVRKFSWSSLIKKIEGILKNQNSKSKK